MATAEVRIPHTHQQDKRLASGRAESSSSSVSVDYLLPDRPWLSMYGMRVRPVAPVGSTSRSQSKDKDPSLIHKALPDELLLEVFSRLEPTSMGRSACVCRRWRYSLRLPALWQAACTQAWPSESSSALSLLVRQQYSSSWRAMWVQRPRLRTEGLYVSRNTYMRVGIAEWRVKNPVHMVCYYRYILFLPNGKFLYKTSPTVVREVSKQMHQQALHNPRVTKVVASSGSNNSNRTNHSSSSSSSSHPHHSHQASEGIHVGRYSFSNDMVHGALVYPGKRPTLVRIQLRLRSTCPGANNRLDVLSLLTSGLAPHETVRAGDLDAVLDELQQAQWDDAELMDPDFPSVAHQRGTSTFVFVPFEQAETDILNLPIDKMDFYIPG